MTIYLFTPVKVKEEELNKKVVIIGGGAAGIFAALAAKDS